MVRRFLYILLVAVFAPHIIYADGTPPSDAADPAVTLVVGRSTVVNVGKPIARVSLTSADVADAMVTAPGELLINGKNPGTISMFVWDRGGALRRYEVTVQRDVARLSEQMKTLFPNEHIGVDSNGRGVVLSGSVSTKDVADRAVSLAGGYVDKKDDVTNLLQIAEGGASNQVLLRVRFAEVSRNAMTELGASFLTSPTGINNTLGRITTGQFQAPGYQDLQWSKSGSGFGDPVTSASGKLSFSDFLNVFVLSEKYDLGVVIRALGSKGLFQSLAEPNLVAESGKEASFLAGGEFPIPIAQPSGGGTSITVEFKEFGIRLSFTPTVNGNRIHLKVKPEVSSLDFNNAVILNGFRIPALTTRRAETELELLDHQTFAMAGLINNTMLETMQRIPGVGDIPILGLLFKSKAAQKDRTELVVMITPEILHNNSVGVTDQLPKLQEPYLSPLTEKKSFSSPPAGFVAPDGPLAPKSPTASPRTDASPAAQPSLAGSTPEAAAAAVRALTPGGPQIVASAPAQPAPAAAAPSQAPVPAAASAPAQPVPAKPLTPQEKKALEQAQKEEAKQRKAEEQAKAMEGQRAAKQLEAERKAAVEQQARDEKLAKEQAKKDAEAKKQADKAAKKAAEDAKRQAEKDKDQQKQIDEAAAKLKAAQSAYDAELAKKQKQ